MRASSIGWELSKLRRRAGLTQQELAERLGTTQSAISRIESGGTIPSLLFLERFAGALGRPLTITLGPTTAAVADVRERRARAQKVLRGYVFDPWRRDPTPVEARSLEADGLTRERFEGSEAP